MRPSQATYGDIHSSPRQLNSNSSPVNSSFCTTNAPSSTECVNIILTMTDSFGDGNSGSGYMNNIPFSDFVSGNVMVWNFCVVPGNTTFTFNTDLYPSDNAITVQYAYNEQDIIQNVPFGELNGIPCINGGQRTCIEYFVVQPISSLNPFILTLTNPNRYLQTQTGAFDYLQLSLNNLFLTNPTTSMVTLTLNGTNLISQSGNIYFSLFDTVGEMLCNSSFVNVTNSLVSSRQSVMMLNGTLSKINDCIQHVIYSLSPKSNYEGSSNIFMQASDNGNNLFNVTKLSTISTINLIVSLNCGGYVNFNGPGVIRDRLVSNGTLMGSSYIPNQQCFWIVNQVNMVMSTIFGLEEENNSPIISYIEKVPPSESYCGNGFNDAVRFKSFNDNETLYISFTSNAEIQSTGFELILSKDYRDTSVQTFQISINDIAFTRAYTAIEYQTTFSSLFPSQGVLFSIVSSPSNLSVNMTLPSINSTSSPLILLSNLFVNAFDNVIVGSNSSFSLWLKKSNAKIVSTSYTYGSLPRCSHGWIGYNDPTICSCFPNYYGPQCSLTRPFLCNYVSKVCTNSNSQGTQSSISASCCSIIQDNVFISSSIDNQLVKYDTFSSSFQVFLNGFGPFYQNNINVFCAPLVSCIVGNSIAIHPEQGEMYIISSLNQILSFDAYTSNFLYVVADQSTLESQGFVGVFQPLYIVFNPDMFLHVLDASGIIIVLDENGNFVSIPFQDLNFLYINSGIKQVKKLQFSPVPTKYSPQTPDINGNTQTDFYIDSSNTCIERKIYNNTNDWNYSNATIGAYKLYVMLLSCEFTNQCVSELWVFHPSYGKVANQFFSNQPIWTELRTSRSFSVLNDGSLILSLVQGYLTRYSEDARFLYASYPFLLKDPSYQFDPYDLYITPDDVLYSIAIGGGLSTSNIKGSFIGILGSAGFLAHGQTIYLFSEGAFAPNCELITTTDFITAGESVTFKVIVYNAKFEKVTHQVPLTVNILIDGATAFSMESIPDYYLYYNDTDPSIVDISFDPFLRASLYIITVNIGSDSELSSPYNLNVNPLPQADSLSTKSGGTGLTACISGSGNIFYVLPLDFFQNKILLYNEMTLQIQFNNGNIISLPTNGLPFYAENLNELTYLSMEYNADDGLFMFMYKINLNNSPRLTISILIDGENIIGSPYNVPFYSGVLNTTMSSLVPPPNNGYLLHDLNPFTTVTISITPRDEYGNLLVGGVATGNLDIQIYSINSGLNISYSRIQLISDGVIPSIQFNTAIEQNITVIVKYNGNNIGLSPLIVYCQNLPMPMDPAIIGTAVVLATMGIIISVGLIIFVEKSKHLTLMKMSQYHSLYGVLAGTILSFSDSLVLSLMKKSQLQCTLDIMFGNLGFSITYGFLIAKTWRIYTIMQSAKTKTQVKITVRDMTIRVVAYLCVISIIAIVKASSIQVTRRILTSSPIYSPNNNIQYFEIKECNYWISQSFTFAYLVSGINSCLFVYGMYMAWMSRRLSDKLTEAKGLAFTLYLCAMQYFVTHGIISAFAANISASAEFFLEQMFTLVGAYLPLAFLFLRKVVMVYRNIDINIEGTHQPSSEEVSKKNLVIRVSNPLSDSCSSMQETSTPMSPMNSPSMIELVKNREHRSSTLREKNVDEGFSSTTPPMITSFFSTNDLRLDSTTSFSSHREDREDSTRL